MNDSTEIDFLFEAAAEVISNGRFQSPLVSAEAGAAAAESLRQSSRANVFSVSFSSHRDRLSQWRGYTRGGGTGIALGFRVARLREAAAKAGARFAACSYGESAAQEAAVRLLAEAAEAALHLDDRPVLERFSATAYSRILRSAPFHKHDAFEEEGEFRLAIGPVRFDSGIRSRVVEGQVLPYVEVAAPASNGGIDLNELVFGPGWTPQDFHAFSLLTSVHRAMDIDRLHFRYAKAPYRP